MNSHATVSVELAPAAEETGFEQGVQAMRGTLSTTPVGWLLVGWMCWGGVPLGAVLAGVAAVNAPVCITMPRSFRALLVAMGLAALPDWVQHPQQVGVVQTLIGRTVFMTLLGYDVASIAQRVLEGIRLQFANEALAEQLRHALQLVEQAAATDALTGQPDRRALDQFLTRQVARRAAE